MEKNLYLYCLIFKIHPNWSNKGSIITNKIVDDYIGQKRSLVFLNLEDALDYVNYLPMHTRLYKHWVNITLLTQPLNKNLLDEDLSVDFNVECEDGSMKLYSVYIYKIQVDYKELIHHMGKKEYEKLNQ